MPSYFRRDSIELTVGEIFALRYSLHGASTGPFKIDGGVKGLIYRVVAKQNAQAMDKALQAHDFSGDDVISASIVIRPNKLGLTAIQHCVAAAVEYQEANVVKDPPTPEDHEAHNILLCLNHAVSSQSNQDR